MKSKPPIAPDDILEIKSLVSSSARLQPVAGMSSLNLCKGFGTARICVRFLVNLVPAKSGSSTVLLVVQLKFLC